MAILLAGQGAMRTRYTASAATALPEHDAVCQTTDTWPPAPHSCLPASQSAVARCHVDQTKHKCQRGGAVVAATYASNWTLQRHMYQHRGTGGLWSCERQAAANYIRPINRRTV